MVFVVGACYISRAVIYEALARLGHLDASQMLVFGLVTFWFTSKDFEVRGQHYDYHKSALLGQLRRPTAKLH